MPLHLTLQCRRLYQYCKTCKRFTGTPLSKRFLQMPLWRTLPKAIKVPRKAQYVAKSITFAKRRQSVKCDWIVCHTQNVHGKHVVYTTMVDTGSNKRTKTESKTANLPVKPIGQMQNPLTHVPLWWHVTSSHRLIEQLAPTKSGGQRHCPAP